MGITPLTTTWYSSALPDMSTEESNYTSAQSSYTASYDPKYSALTTTTAGSAAHKTAIDTFEANLASFISLRNSLKTAADSLKDIQQSGYESVDALGSSTLTALLTQLSGKIDRELTLAGFDSNALLTELSTKDGIRQDKETLFIQAINNFRTSQSTLALHRNQYLEEYDKLLVLQEKLAFNNAGGAPAYSVTQADVDTQDAIVAGFNATLQSDLLARSSSQSAIANALSEYSSAINDEIDVINTGYVRKLQGVSQDTSDFINALAAAQSFALTTVNTALQSALTTDAASLADHNALFPLDNSQVQEGIGNEEVGLQNASSGYITQISTSSNAFTAIDIPALPSSGQMSINDLMRFISSIQQLIQKLARELKASDNNIDTLRMQVWQAQGTYEVAKQSLLLAWLSRVEQADKDYNLEAAQSNHALSQDLVNKINYFKSIAPQINAVIDDLNDDIDEQNENGVQVTLALNNSHLIATDVLYRGGKQPQDVVTETDMQTFVPSVEPSDSAPFANPTTIEHYPNLNTGLITIPASIPIASPGANNLPPAADELPTQAEIDSFNQTIAYINSILYPIKERLLAAGIDLDPVSPGSNDPYNLIDKFFVRQYTPVREVTEILDLTTPLGATAIYAILALQNALKRQYSTFISKDAAPPSLEKLFDLSRVAVTENANRTAAATGAGVGLLQSNLAARPSRVTAAVDVVIGSTEFLDTVNSLIEQSSLIGGLQTATLLPTSIANYSQMGLVKDDFARAVGEAADERTSIASEEPAVELTAADRSSAGNIATQLIGLANDVPALRQRVVELVQKSGKKDLTEDELNELIKALLYILQLLLLLVAALAVAVADNADGVAVENSDEKKPAPINLSQLIAELFAAPPTAQAEVDQLIADLKALGVTDLPQTLPITAPEFVETLGNDLATNLSTDELASLKSEILDIFAQYGIQALFSAEADLGSQIATLLFTAPIADRGEIRNAIINLEINRGQILRQELARARIQELIIVESNTLPAQDRERLTAALNQQENSYTIPGLSQEEQNAFIIALATNIITPDEGTSILRAFTEATQSDATISRLLAFANDQKRSEQRRSGGSQDPVETATGVPAETVATPVTTPFVTPIPVNEAPPQTSTATNAPRVTDLPLSAQISSTTTAPGATEATPIVPKIGGVLGAIASIPAEPKNPRELLRDAFEQLSAQTDDNRFTYETVLDFSRSIEGQTDFYSRSLDLILDPARKMVKNFSITTRDRTDDTPLSIPLSG
jgi:hypothetical protein